MGTFSPSTKVGRHRQYARSAIPRIFCHAAQKEKSPEAPAKMVHFVILNEVKDLNISKIRDSSLGSE
jgi:hypothetical protein